MKRFQLAIFLILMAMLTMPVFGMTARRSLGMDITAYNGQYHDIIIRELSGNLSDPVGMPFDLTAEDVKYIENEDSTAGRQIALWSLHSNYTPVHIMIQADNLKHEDASSGENKTIGYFLYWPYKYELPNGSEVSGYMKVESGDEGYDSWEDSNVNDDKGEYEAISDQLENNYNPISIALTGGLDTSELPIRFMLDENTSENINSYEPGPYSAAVTVTMEGT